MDLHVPLFPRGRRRGLRLLASLLISMPLAMLLPLAASAAEPSSSAPVTGVIPISAPLNSPSIVLDPTSAGAENVHWTVTLYAQYCGGYQVGGYVEIAPQWDGALPAAIPADSVQFAGGAAKVTRIGDALRVGPAPGRVWAEYCTDGPVSFDIEIDASAGMMNPATPGDYSVMVSTGAAPTPVPVSVSITGAQAATPAPGPTVVVGMDNSGQTIDLNVRQHLKLALGDGYQWTPTVVDSTVLGPMYGTPNEFVAMQPGATLIVAFGTPENCSWDCLIRAQIFWSPVVVHE